MRKKHQRIKKNKWRYYLPDGRCLDSEKKLDDFLLEKLRPAFDKELCNRVIDMAATAIPGVDKSELSISDAENEKAASLNVKLNGKTYKEAILPYVSYKGVISSSPKPMKNREMTVPLISSGATIRAVLVSREKSFWMKQASRLYTMKRVGTNPKS